MPGCGNPYLRWHHFDPPWHAREHHEVEGMIALCAEHHDKADHAAFTDDQLRQFKKRGADTEIVGRFDWMRDKLLAVVGGNLYFDVPVPLQVEGRPCIWFNRSDDGHFLLNVDMPTLSGKPRLKIEDNFWISTGEPDDLECPPKGTLVAATYRNGDILRVEFAEMASEEAFIAKYPFLAKMIQRHPQEGMFPCAVVEIRMGIVASVIDLGPKGSRFRPGRIEMSGTFMSRCAVGLSLGQPPTPSPPP